MTTTIITKDGGQYQITETLENNTFTEMVRLKGTLMGIIEVPITTKARKNFVITTSVNVGNTYKTLFFNRVHSETSLNLNHYSFLIDCDKIIINCPVKLKRPVFTVSFQHDLNTEFIKINRVTTLKPTKPAKSDLYGFRKTKNKVSWGGKSSTSQAQGTHHILENHSFKCGKGEITLVDCFVFYREKGKPDYLVASIQKDDILSVHIHPECDVINNKTNARYYKTAQRMLKNRFFEQHINV
jgi:hypothetical protein